MKKLIEKTTVEQALEALKYAASLGYGRIVRENSAPFTIKTALAQPPLPVQPEQEAASIIQAITDPENQPSQYGTITLDYHFAKLKEWEDRFEKLSNRVLAQPPLPVQRQPLTNERIDKIHASLFQGPFDPEDILNMRVASRAIEAAHNIGAKP